MTKWTSLGVIIDYSQEFLFGEGPKSFAHSPYLVFYVTQINTSYVDLSSSLCSCGRITEKRKPTHSKGITEAKSTLPTYEYKPESTPVPTICLFFAALHVFFS